MDIKVGNTYKTKIINQNNEGLGVGYVNDLVVFVENGLPDEEGMVEITEIRKNYARGKMINSIITSNQRQKAPCPYFGECGGCELQHQIHDYQLLFKKHKVQMALEHIGGLKNINVDNVISENEFHYRNKVTLKVNKDKIGFYKQNTNDIIDIDECLISNAEINKTIKLLQAFVDKHQDNGFKTIMIRYCDSILIDIESKDNYLIDELVSFITSELANINTIVFNNKIVFGSGFLITHINNLQFKLSASSFYQTNNAIMQKMYEKVLEHASRIDNDTILDLYCGIGTITLLLSKYAKNIIGIESNEAAIDNAKENLVLNNINNVSFKEGIVENIISTLLEEKIDTIVMDPPRSGVDNEALNALLSIKPKQIIYVSCNPATLARDLKILCNNDYNIKEIIPFDMFPQTSHVETVVLMSKVE